MLSYENFQLLLYIMSGIAVIVFLCLYFVKAGYGMFRTSRWGWSINNKVAWILMEAPVFFVMLWVWTYSGNATFALPQFFFLLLFEIHYFQRSFVFPCLMSGHSKMPVAIMLMGITFNVINGLMQGLGLFAFPPEAYSEGAAYLGRSNAIVGIVVFVAGFCVNLHSDSVIRHLRKPGDTRHYLPQKGMYRYITSGNYFGELLEWIGFAIAAATPAAWVFAWWTAANLVPRAHAINKRYRQEFGDEAVGNRKRIIPFIY